MTKVNAGLRIAKEPGKGKRLFDVWTKGNTDPWRGYAKTRAEAKYYCFLDFKEAYPGISFIEFLRSEVMQVGSVT